MTLTRSCRIGRCKQHELSSVEFGQHRERVTMCHEVPADAGQGGVMVAWSDLTARALSLEPLQQFPCWPGIGG